MLITDDTVVAVRQEHTNDMECVLRRDFIHSHGMASKSAEIEN